jgi:hypothetical protein
MGGAFLRRAPFHLYPFFSTPFESRVRIFLVSAAISIFDKIVARKYLNFSQSGSFSCFLGVLAALGVGTTTSRPCRRFLIPLRTVQKPRLVGPLGIMALCGQNSGQSTRPGRKAETRNLFCFPLSTVPIAAFFAVMLVKRA